MFLFRVKQRYLIGQTLCMLNIAAVCLLVPVFFFVVLFCFLLFLFVCLFVFIFEGLVISATLNVT